MSIRDEGVSFSLEVNVEKAYQNVRRLQTVLYRTLALVKQASGDENLDRFITNAQRAIAIANQLRLALAALQALRMASGDPFAWAMAGLAVAEVGADVLMGATGY